MNGLPPVDISAVSMALVGAGKMGSALLAGLRGGEKQGKVLVIEPNPAPEVTHQCREKGFELATAIAENASPVDVLLLAIKPQMLDAVAPALKPLLGPDTLILSILAGKRISDLSSRLSARAFVRAMPNTPAAIGRGVSGAFAAKQTSQTQRALAEVLLSAAGTVEWVESEDQIDAVTAVSGSGPAYVFYLAECLAAAGVAAGLPEDLSMRLARATVSGAGELMHRAAEISPATLRENVTSPGGTTAAALDILMAKDGLKPLLERAVASARRRADELSG